MLKNSLGKSGYVGQYIESGASETEVTTGFTNGQWRTIATMILNKGNYLVRGCVLFGGSTNNQPSISLGAAISRYPDHTTSDHRGNKNTHAMLSNNSTTDAHIEISGYRMQITSDNTPVYYKAVASNWGGGPVIRAHISAICIQ